MNREAMRSRVEKMSVGDMPTITLGEHTKTDSKLLWSIIFIIGGLIGNFGDSLITYITPGLSEKFVTKEESVNFATKSDLDALREEILNGFEIVPPLSEPNEPNEPVVPKLR